MQRVAFVEARLRPFEGVSAGAQVTLAPYTLHPKPYTLPLTPYTLHPTPCTLHPTPFTWGTKPSTSTVNRQPQTSQTLNRAGRPDLDAQNANRRTPA